MPPLSGYTYMLWGKARPQNQAEPNNQLRDEYCAVANYSQSQQGGEMQAWAWSDARCNMTAPFICKVSGGSRGPSWGVQAPAPSRWSHR